MSQKFHINSAGDVRVCNATVKPCRFGENDHFTDKNEARREIENRLSSEFGSAQSLSKSKTRSEDKSSSDFTARISKLTKNSKPNNEELQQIGAVIDEELRSRLDFDPFDHELSSDEIQAVQAANRAIFSGLVKNGGDIPTVLTGPFADSLNEAVSILPDSVKASIGKAPIFTKLANKNNRKFDGRHSYGIITQTVKARSQVRDLDIPEDAPDGSFIPVEDSYSLREIEHPRSGIRVWVKNGDSRIVEDRWVGRKPEHARARKVADKAEMFIRGQLVTIDKPVYALYTEEKTVGSEITAKKTSDKNEMHSVLLHEFCHAVQRRSNGLVDEEEATMYDSLAYGERTYDLDYGIIKHRGLPNGYMGHADGDELLPVATEAFFHPSTVNKGFLYGSDRGENADKVRQWVSGLWVSLGSRSL